MPFASKQQWRLCFQKKDPNWDCERWARESVSFHDLPEYKKSVKKSVKKQTRKKQTKKTKQLKKKQTRK